MVPQSIRWRLPLSYAAIALLATLCLGAVLLIILRNYYGQQELNYLTSNARGISLELAGMVEKKLPPAAMAAQLKSFSFLTQTRVRWLDKDGQVVADSGDPQNRRQVTALSVEVEANQPGVKGLFSLGSSESVPAEAVPGYVPFIYVQEPNPADLEPTKVVTRTMVIVQGQGPDRFFKRVIEEAAPVEGQQIVSTKPVTRVFLTASSDEVTLSPDFMTIMPALQTPFGFKLNVEPALDDRRSSQRISLAMYDTAGNQLGTVELSQGPAYGLNIVESVAWGWAIASSNAVLLAAGVGWLASRRLSDPLLALTGVTTRMAGGDLSARADVAREDELGQLARSFNEMANQVEETVVTLRRFVADAAHELHTPLTALRTNLDLAAGEANGDRPVFVERAQAQVDRLERLTNDLLDLSRLEAGPVEEALKPVDLVTLLQEMGEPYASRAEQAGLVFSLDLPAESVLIQGHAAQLRRAVGNLLDNALKFTPEGGTIHLSLDQATPPGWEIRVEDTGIGIPSEDLAQLFGRFHRGRNAAAYPGSGLGLAIVKAISDHHGGKVTAENQAEGACFRLYLSDKSLTA